MNDAIDMAKWVLGLSSDDPLPAENQELTPEQSLRFDEMIEAELSDGW